MGIQEFEIAADQVTVGMFVCRLDRPWTETPFPLQGFVIRSQDQIDVLRIYCRTVWIDVELGRAVIGSFIQYDGAPSSSAAAATSQPQPQPQPAAAAPRIPTVSYVNSVDLFEEVPAARLALDAATALTARMVDDVRAGLSLGPDDVRSAASPIVESVLRNADALFWVNALRQRDGYAYTHAINCSALAAAFGRHLGLPPELLIELASGAMLMDIGKTQVPEALLEQPGALDPMAMARVRRHVELGIQVLGDGKFSPIVREMVLGHHERADGSGYPARRRAADIPLHVRIAAIVDSFDAMTSERPHAPAQSRHDALQELYRARDTRYFTELVEQFISCLGVYPTGSLAELESGEIVAIMGQNPARRLRPRVLMLTDGDHIILPAFRAVDMLSEEALSILRPLPDGHAGIDLAELYL